VAEKIREKLQQLSNISGESTDVSSCKMTIPKYLLRFQPLLFTGLAAILGIVLGLSLKSWR
jgi:hypothetical protein